MIHQTIRQDAATAIIRSILTLASGGAELEEHRGTQWASATFAGMRHVMRLRFNGNEAVALGEWLAAAKRRAEATNGLAELDAATPAN